MRSHIGKYLVLGLFVQGGVVISASAQTSGSSAVVRDQVVVTATLVEEVEEELPVSAEVIGAGEIEDRQATTVADLLATAAGLQVVQSGSSGQVTSLFTRGTESDHTLVLWNGIELNNPYFGGFDWAFLPTEGVERVEVVRGPFSALHGSDALGGAIQVVSGGDRGGRVRFEISENSYARGAVSAAAPLGNGHLQVAGHIRQGDGTAENDFFRGGEFVALAEWEVGANGSIGLATRVNDSTVGIPFSTGVPSPNRRISWQERQLALPFELTLGAWRIESQLSSSVLDSSFRDPDDAFGFTESDTRSTSARFRSQASRRLETNAGPKGWWAFGLEAERLEVDDRSVFGVNLAGVRQKTNSVFAQSLLRFDRVSLDLGARFDDSDVYGGRLTPRVGVLVPLGDQASMRASYGEGFRAPSLGELFFPFSGNARLEPETSESYELGLEVKGAGGILDLALYENRLENLIDFDFTTFTNINIGRAETRGIEGSYSISFAKTSLRANATVARAKDETTGLALLRRPELRAAVVISRSLGGLRLTGTGLYVGGRADVDPVSFERQASPSHVRLDLAAEWRDRARWRPYGRIENLADETYSEALGFPAPGRTVVAGMSLGWL